MCNTVNSANSFLDGNSMTFRSLNEQLFTSIENSTKLCIQVSGSNAAILLPANSDNMAMLRQMKVVEIERDWSGSLKGVYHSDKLVEAVIIKESVLTDRPESKVEKIKRLEEAKAKVAAEAAAIQVEIDAA